MQSCLTARRRGTARIHRERYVVRDRISRREQRAGRAVAEFNAGAVLRIGYAFESFDVVFAFSRGNSLENSFRRYIEQMRPRENLKIYCDWGLHDDLSDNIELTEEMTRNNINKLDILMKKSGVRFDYYLMDAFWFEENQPYICFKERTFPKGIDYIIQMLEEKGTNSGYGSISTVSMCT